MEKDIWYLEGVDFNRILCPYKYEDYVKRVPPLLFKKHDFLFFENDPLQEIILIDHGKVKIGHYDRDGNERVIAILGMGEVLGQMGLLGERNHHVFAEVIEEGTQVCKMSMEKARELTRDYVSFAMEMNRRISGQIRKLERRIEILLFKDIKLRLLELLLDMANDYGRERDGQILISHSLTQTDFAMLAGTSRKSASLILNELENQGLIQFNRKQIFIKDLRELKENANQRRSSNA
ncbi:MAG: Crp/Fnr family transcriptional regulator [Saprospiraceae bacterium]|uniref:Crp/Fnr family transcriptional regulator n=1 Tax=Candidatus Opimibacter skivensis TaxID=2982028 RepID=A0A9D7SZF2_9BACT|nr:Crp/Fnr family transcriptional regulator [Candidatus Opimibacter skivensis]